MAYCRECGAELKDDAKFCFKCGATTGFDGTGEEVGGTGGEDGAAQASTDTSGGVLMTTEASKKLADELHNKYAEYEKSEHDIADMEQRAKELNQNLGGQASGFKYFWPTLIAAPAAFFITRFIVKVLFDADIIYHFEDEAPLLIPSIVTVIVVVIGIIIAVKNTNSANASIEAEMASNKERRKKLLEDVEALKKRREELGNELAQYEDLVPEHFRNSSSMSKVKYILSTGKATDFKDAIRKAILS